METYEILKYPDERLHTVSQSVEQIFFGTVDLTKIVKKMFNTMIKNNGIGLAAPQVNIHKRIIVISVDNSNHVLINPVIIKKSVKLKSIVEGCLSIPYTNGKVSRPNKISVKFYDINGNMQILDAEGLLSACIQHEIDHLNGVVYLNRLSKLKRYFLMKRLNKK